MPILRSHDDQQALRVPSKSAEVNTSHGVNNPLMRQISRPLGKVFLSIIAGWLYHFAFPGFDVWPIAFFALALFWFVLQDSGFWSGLSFGVLFFGVFYGFHIEWLTLYLGIVPWLALTAAMVLSGMLAAGLIGWLNLRIHRFFKNNIFLGAVIRAFTFAAVWIVWEGIASRFPYGGFSWGRLSFAFSESAYSSLFSYLGAAGVAFVLLFLLVLALESLAFVSIRLAAVPVVLLLVLPFIPIFMTTEVGSKTIAAVQGNADASLNSKSPRGTVLRNHLEETEKIEAEDIDLLVWPENAADLDPLRDPFAESAMNYLTDRFNAPVIAGTITRSGDDFFNSALLWLPGEGYVNQYDKKHPVPFAEYMPNREFFMMLAPDLVSLVSRDYQFGTRSSIFELPGFQAGIAICYDIADDDLMRDMVLDGAEIILAPTNNADFGQTDQNQQQLAIARIRALESGRSVVNISTVGTSEIIDADGRTLAALTPYDAGHMVTEVPLYQGKTPATIIGNLPEIIAGVWILLVLLSAAVQHYFFLRPLRSRK